MSLSKPLTLASVRAQSSALQHSSSQTVSQVRVTVSFRRCVRKLRPAVSCHYALSILLLTLLPLSGIWNNSGYSRDYSVDLCDVPFFWTTGFLCSPFLSLTLWQALMTGSISNCSKHSESSLSNRTVLNLMLNKAQIPGRKSTQPGALTECRSQVHQQHLS